MKLGKLACGVGLAMGVWAGAAHAVLIGGPFEMDLDNWTRLYNSAGTAVPEGSAPALGYESRAYLKFNQIAPTAGPGGADQPATWVAGTTDGTYLYGIERNVTISKIFQRDAISPVIIYFDHVTTDPTDARYWELSLIRSSSVTTADFEKDDGTGTYLGLGPNAFNTIESNLLAAAGTSEILRGRFATSTFYDPVEDFVDNLLLDGSAGVTSAVVAISIPFSLLGGQWVDQISTPFGLAVNAFIDVDPTFGIGGTLGQNVYGPGRDLAIQNVRLFSELGSNVNPGASGGNWIISDDGVRGIPEPSTVLLLGLALAGFGLVSMRRRA
jgi:hypothetical protein